MDAVNVRTPYYDTCAVIGVVSASSSKPCTADQWFGHTTLVSSTANVLFTIHQSLCSLIGNLQYHRAKGIRKILQEVETGKIRILHSADIHMYRFSK